MPSTTTTARGFVPLLDRFDDAGGDDREERRDSALIIEDDDIVAAVLERLLWSLGFRSIERARSRVEALRSARLRPPDLVTADVWLGGHGPEGIGTAYAINTIEYSAVVFVTATPDIFMGDRKAIVLDKADLTLEALGAAISAAKTGWSVH